MSQQTETWAGEFGREYTLRNKPGPDEQMHRQIFWQRVLDSASKANSDFDPQKLQSVFELGCGRGDNLVAIKQECPTALMSGIDVNETAVRAAREHGFTIGTADARHARTWMTGTWGEFVKPDLVLTRGLLIHIPPIDLSSIYRQIYKCAGKYIIMAEYYAPTATEVEYRGMKKHLWRNDFAGQFMAQYPDVFLIDYGFAYHRDHAAPQDDLTWFVMRKS